MKSSFPEDLDIFIAERMLTDKETLQKRSLLTWQKTKMKTMISTFQ